MNKHPFRADLHCHSTASDGTLTPEELIELAKERGLQGLAICDHDTIGGFLQARAKAKELNILLGSGVEFSCQHQGISVHVLGYDFLPDNQELLALCKRHESRRSERNKKIVKNLRALGVDIKEEELLTISQEKMIGRPHIAKILVDKGVVPNFETAFQRYLAEGKPAFSHGETFSLEETLAVIHAARGKAFLAHPHLHRGRKEVKKILELPFDGVECYYARFTEKEAQSFLEIAHKQSLLISGGSDFHGSIKPHSYLGSSFVDEIHFWQIFTNLHEKLY